MSYLFISVVRVIQMANTKQHNADNVVVGQQDGCVFVCVSERVCVCVSLFTDCMCLHSGEPVQASETAVNE